MAEKTTDWERIESDFVGNMRAEERELHALFGDQRVRGEWFRLSSEDLQQIAQRAMLV